MHTPMKTKLNNSDCHTPMKPKLNNSDYLDLNEE
jgi:hypothetical protein